MMNERTLLMVEIIRFCGLSRDETRIRKIQPKQRASRSLPIHTKTAKNAYAE